MPKLWDAWTHTPSHLKATLRPHLPVLGDIPGLTLSSPEHGHAAPYLRRLPTIPMTPWTEKIGLLSRQGDSHALQFLVLGERSSRDGSDGVLLQASGKQSREESINHLLINKWLPGALRTGSFLPSTAHILGQERLSQHCQKPETHVLVSGGAQPRV